MDGYTKRTQIQVDAEESGLFSSVWWMSQFYKASASSIFIQTHLKGMALVFGGQSTRGLLYLQARTPAHRAFECSREPFITIE